MERVRTIAGSGLVLALALSAPYAWSQTAPNNAHDQSDQVYASSMSSGSESAPLMDQRVSQDIKRAWSGGKNATAAMAFQENGEVAMSEGKDREAKRYFSRAERELATLEPEEPSE